MKRVRFVLALGFVVAVLGALAFLRRHSELLEGVYDRSNVLRTTEATGIPLARFLGMCVSTQFSIVVGGLAAIPLIGLRKRLVPLLGAIGVFACAYYDSATRLATHIGGHLYFCICDDAFISMRYARNFANGHGLVYNAGEWVEGYTNPLWTLLMSIPLALGVHEGTAPAIVVAFGGLLLVLAAVFVWRVLERLAVPKGVQVLVLCALLFDASNFDFALKGLETPLLTACATMVVCGWLLGREGVVLVGLALLPPGRADGALVAGLLLGWMVLESWLAGRRSLGLLFLEHRRRLIVWLGSCAAMVAWHWLLYGELAPNTYYLKVYALADRLSVGIAEYAVRGALYYGAATLFVVWMALVQRAARPAARMLLPIGAMWLYGMFIGGDAFPHLRFVAPLLPMLWIAVGRSAAAVWKHLTLPSRVAWGAMLAMTAPVHGERGVLGATWDTQGWIRDNLIAAKTMSANVPAGSLVGIFYAGTVPYYAPSLRFLDLLGKAEPKIARQKRIYGTIPGHNKFDFAYAYAERRPDLTFSALSCDEVDAFVKEPIEGQRAMVAGLSPLVYTGPLYQPLDPTFRSLYMPNRVIARTRNGPAGHTMGCWYIREGSPIPRVWEIRYF